MYIYRISWYGNDIFVEFLFRNSGIKVNENSDIKKILISIKLLRFSKLKKIYDNLKNIKYKILFKYPLNYNTWKDLKISMNDSSHKNYKIQKKNL